MKSTFKENQVVILVIIIAVFIGLTIVGYLYPTSALGELLRYYNGISSLIIVLLTLMYVITTNRQLLAMQNQLNVMDSSVKLQIQPLPVPSIKEIYLEKIRAYSGPESGFTKVELLSRFHFKIDFKNAGTGAALNISVFPTICLRDNDKKDHELEIPDITSSQIHLICENETQEEGIHNTFMILDRQFEIFKALNNRKSEVLLRLRIYYKNIFGSGFLEEAQYSLSFEKDQAELVKSWDEFISTGISALNEDIVRFESLISKLPKEAHESFDKVNDHLKERFDKDLILEYSIEPSSYNVSIVDFETSLAAARKRHDEIVKSYDPASYRMLENWRLNKRQE